MPRVKKPEKDHEKRQASSAERRVPLVPTTHARHDGRTCDAGIIQRRSYGPVGREPDETKDRSQLKRFVRSQRWGVFFVVDAVLLNEVCQG